MKSQDEAGPAQSRPGLRHFLQQAASVPAAPHALSFSCVPKTFSRKFFMHLEGIEQLEPAHGTVPAAFPSGQQIHQKEIVKHGVKKNLLPRVLQRAKSMPDHKDSSMLKSVAEPRTPRKRGVKHTKSMCSRCCWRTVSHF
jgi:hypothetical protein